MILRNFTDLFSSLLGANTKSVTPTYNNPTRDCIVSNKVFYHYNMSSNSYVKTTLQAYYTNDNPAYSQSMNNNVNCIICVGSGTTPPTVDDLRLENAILDLNFLGGIVTGTSNSVTITTTWGNNTGEAKTINELGVHCCVTWNTGGKYPIAILTRSVLEQPVVMQDGESRTFSITIDFDKMLETSTNE